MDDSGFFTTPPEDVQRFLETLTEWKAVGTITARPATFVV